MAEKLAMRSEVPVQETWDLSLIYKTEEDMYADVEKVKSISKELTEDYKGKLDTPEAIVACLDKYGEFYKRLDWIWTYTGLAVEVDYYDNKNQERSNAVNAVLDELLSGLSFIESEISEQSEEVLKQAVSQASGCKNYLKEILRNKPHRLSAETERVLAAISHTTNAPYELYNTVKLADMKFDSFVVDGKEYPLGYSLFEDDYEYNPDTAVRRTAFAKFSQKIKEYENVTAAAYNAYVQHEKIMSRLRGFDTMWEPNLFQDKVDRTLYDRQIDLIMEHLAPHMRKYANLIKEIHGLDKMTYADLKLPVDPDYSPDVTIEKSKEYIREGLSVFGSDYAEMIDRAYEQRWIDFAKNAGKCTGGFCASPYQKGSFILMTWNGKMSDVFTLAHELGHAGHFRLAGEAQSVFDANVDGYLVEAPSTMNELLMAHYMLKTSDDKRFRRWVLANMVSNTYYHNFVTHLLEADYQREVYKIVDAGGSVQAETLSKIMRETLKKFWGGEVELTEGAELTWMRQPHYYMGLYSYAYSAGLTIATQVCRRVETEGQAAIEDWKKALKAGGTLTPVEFAAQAGVDITTDAALLDTIEMIGSYIDEICELTKELNTDSLFCKKID